MIHTVRTACVPVMRYRDADVADGYGNRRVVVLDADTGRYKRHWGAYGGRPDDTQVPAYNPAAPPSKHFNTVHCTNVSKDGFVYVCDRVNDRVQVFRKDGTFVKEAFFEKSTLRSGSVWDMTFSRDPQQTYIYIANGVNEKISLVLRSTLEVLTAPRASSWRWWPRSRSTLRTRNRRATCAPGTTCR